MELESLYQEIILEHAKKPRNFGLLEDPTHSSEGYNPLCGDQVTLTLRVENNVIQEIGFIGCGCSISMATASLMAEAIKGLSTEDAVALSSRVVEVVKSQAENADELGELAALSGVHRFPMRVKCATLALHAIQDALASGSISDR